MIVGRRGPEHSAFTLPELIGLSTTAGVSLVVDPADLPTSPQARRRREARAPAGLAAAARPAGRRRSACATASRRSDSSATDRVERRRVRRATGDGRHRDRCRPRAHRDRLPRPARRRRCRSTRRTGTVPNEAGRVVAGRRRRVAGHLRRRLDQARPDRLHRHQQALRPGDRRARWSRTTTRAG